NWESVQAGFSPDSATSKWFERAFGERRDPAVWSEYATSLYLKLLHLADRDGWTHKLRYLLYEDSIAAEHVAAFRGLRGVLLQSKPHEKGDRKGCSRHPGFEALQHELKSAEVQR